MRTALLTLGLALLCSCYCSHQRPDPDAAFDAGADASIDAEARRRDAGYDAGHDAGPPWLPPPGVCSPPPEWTTDRFVGDTQTLRDQEHSAQALFSECTVGEGCLTVLVSVGSDGVVVSTDPAELRDQACTNRALLGLCLPTLAETGEGELNVCGV